MCLFWPGYLLGPMWFFEYLVLFPTFIKTSVLYTVCDCVILSLVPPDYYCEAVWLLLLVSVMLLRSFLALSFCNSTMCYLELFYLVCHYE